MSRFAPAPAVRRGQKARLAVAGPSGAGKTWTSLTLAAILGDTTLVIDTERGSSALYADDFTFEVIEWVPPFDPRELAQVLSDHAGSYDVIVIDSLSHFWEGEGGTRDIVDAAAARARGNSYAGWAEGTPAQNRMVAAILNAPCHVLCTMRSKTEYVLEERGGKQVPRKVGMAPIQRPGLEFEFTVTVDLDRDHLLTVDKSRCAAVADRSFKAGDVDKFGSALREWLDGAEPEEQRVTSDQAESLADSMNRILDTNERRLVKDEFIRTFGTPQLLPASRFEGAAAWVADRVTPNRGVDDE